LLIVIVGSSSTGKVYPQNPNLNLSIPSSNPLEEEEGAKKAGDSFELDELFDLNGANFWSDFFWTIPKPCDHYIGEIGKRQEGILMNILKKHCQTTGL
jgi:hypothetical protein